MATKKGLLVSVYKDNMGDSTLNGISSKCDTMILIGEDIPELFEGDENNTLILVKRTLFGKEYLHAEPIKNNGFNWMFGGNFIYTSDSRFPNKYPIAIHDRHE